jgi:hypothetical protein
VTLPDSNHGGRLIYRDADWPHGLSCPACHHVMQDGDPYLERLDAIMVDCELVTSGFCPDCLEDPNP